MSDRTHQIAVDHSESRSALLDALRRNGVFEVRMAHLTTGDYLLNDRAPIERKSVADFATSLIDGALVSAGRAIGSSRLPYSSPHLGSRVQLGACRTSSHPRRGARLDCSHVASPGPALACRLLSHFGSIEGIIAADAAALAEIRGIGAVKAARIRELVTDRTLTANHHETHV